MSDIILWEPVHTVNEFFDMPRRGVADFHGVPHVYACVFDADADEWSSEYSLTPISPAELGTILEAWGIWLRWQSAFYDRTLAENDEHPALTDRAKHDELKPIVDRHLLTAGGFLAIPTFRGSMYPHAMEVCWRA
jgi:hypothetical protein